MSASLQSAAGVASQLYASNALQEASENVLHEIGFTSDLFVGSLWVADKFVFISSVISLVPGAGHLTALIRRILNSSRNVTIVAPSSSAVLRLVLRNQFQLSFAYDQCLRANIELWTLDQQTFRQHSRTILQSRPKASRLTSDYLSVHLTRLRRGDPEP